MRNKKFLFIAILLFMVVLSIGAISAQDADDAIVSNSTTIVFNDTGFTIDEPAAVSDDSNSVSGGVDVVTENPWNTTGELSYDIPSDAKTIKSADVYVNVYGGSAKNTYGANANITISAGYMNIKHNELLWTEDGSSDGTVYIVNDHTTKCYSDYMIHYDITNVLNGLNWNNLNIGVSTFAMDNKTFDGRIKLIALVLAYDDGDDDVINYWINDNQLWSKTNLTVTFDTEYVTKFTDAVLTNVLLSSADATYVLDDEYLGDADIHESGNYYQANVWDVTDTVKENQKTDLTAIYVGSSTYGSVKNALSILVMNNAVFRNTVSGGVDITTENPWNTTGMLSYNIPYNAKSIKRADVYVNVYGGSAKNTYGANANITITAAGKNAEYNELLWTEDGSSDGTVYIVNDHTTKCYSDYMIHYDITNMVNGLSGTKLNIDVSTFAMDNKTFDGRIKLIALVLAYDDGDDDEVNYWISDDQLWSKTNVTVTFDTEYVTEFTEAFWINVLLSSADATYVLDDEYLGDADIHESGNYYQANAWDVTGLIEPSQETDLTAIYVGSSTYGSVKNALSVLVISNVAEKENVVSGGVDVVTENPWNTTGELNYVIPSDAKTIKSADVYVNVYGGSAKNTYGANANITITAGDIIAEYFESLWIEEGSSDGTVYTVNDHTTKCYSDYMIHYDITNMVNGLSGNNLNIDVSTFAMDNKTFDGRIKLIALVLAYDDGDDDFIGYWINDNQLWSKTNVTVTFDTDEILWLTEANLINVLLSSADATYVLGDEYLGDADIHESGNYYQLNTWNVTDLIKPEQETDLTAIYVGSSTYGSVKNALSVLIIKNSLAPVSAVSGGVDVATVNPWNTTGELIYEIPSYAREIKSADVYVNVYGGSAKNTYGANANITITTANGESQYFESLWTEEGTSDGTVYTVNDHTTKCYSDYMIHYDITDMLNGLRGTDLAINVDTYEMDNKTFDGRIKLIALVLAYDDGDDDVIYYWINDDQLWSKTNVTLTFDSEYVDHFTDATLTNVVLSSGDGTYVLNDEFLDDAEAHESGNYYQYNKWDVTDVVKPNQATDLSVIYAGTSAYGSIKNVLSVLTIYDLVTPNTVSGGVDVVPVNPWNTTGELIYEIPSNAENIKSADVYINVYGGSAKNTYGANANITITTDAGIGRFFESLWTEEGTSDGTVYIVNDHTTKCYSDYMIHYDITDILNGLSGTDLKINVDTYEMDNKTFDGRIKLIALILAYDDGDNDTITYWINDDQLWSKTNVTLTFDTDSLLQFTTATLTNVVLSSGDGTYVLNDDFLGDADVHESGDYYQYNKWDVTNVAKPNQATDLTVIYAGTSAYGSIKNVLSVLTFNNTVLKTDTRLSVGNVNTTFKSGKDLVATLTDAYGNPIADAQVKIEVASLSKTLTTDDKGQVSLSLDGITPGNYIAAITFDGDDTYKKAEAFVTVDINKADTIITAPDVFLEYKDNTGELVATITNANGKALKVNLNVDFNGESYTIKADSNGQISIPIGVLAPGTYTATISYAGNVNYNPSDATANVIVNKANTTITAPDVTVGYGDLDGKLVATITNEYGKALSVYVTVNFNGESYDVRADSKGKITISTADLAIGNYTATIIYNGNGNYNPTTTIATVTVEKANTTIIASDVTVNFADPNGELVATLTDAYGNAISDDVTVVLNGVSYTVTADSEGKIAVSTAKLTPKKYTATITYQGNENYNPASTTAKVTVSKADSIMAAEDVSVAFKDTANSTIATLTNAYGKGLAVYVNVTLNGETFTVRANYWGEISISTAKLTPGTYTATVSYKGNGNYKASNATSQITVTKLGTVMKVLDTSVAYKNTTNKTIARLTDTNGKGLAVYVNVTLNGETFAVRANYWGQISFSTANLAPGTYDVTISYKGNGNYNGSTATAKITVEKAETIITAPDITVAYKDVDGELVATITNAYGKALSVYVTVNLNGESYDVRADSNGQISIPTKALAPGTYTATITYKGNGNYNPTTTTSQITVTKADTVITAPDVSVKSGDPDGKLVATLTNAYGKALSVYVTVNIDGASYNVRADSNGQISIPTANLASGKHTATITYNGNGNYNPTTTTAKITVV